MRNSKQTSVEEANAADPFSEIGLAEFTDADETPVRRILLPPQVAKRIRDATRRYEQSKNVLGQWLAAPKKANLEKTRDFLEKHNGPKPNAAAP